MTLSLIKSPPVVFTDNPSEFVFRKAGILDDVGGYAALYLAIGTAATEYPLTAQILVLEINGEIAVTFTFNNGTDADELNFWDGVEDFDDYAQSLAQNIYRHATLRENYYVRLISYDAVAEVAIIEIRARQRGTAYNIDIDATTTADYIAGSTTVVTVADDDAALGNYKLKLRSTLVYDANHEQKEVDFDDIEAVGLPDTDNNQMEIVVHDLPQLNASLLGVDIPQNAFVSFPVRNIFGELSIEVEESYTGANNRAMVQRLSDLIIAQTIDVFRGGISLPQSVLADLLPWFFADGRYKFLSLQPDRKKLVSTEQPEWLTVIATATGTYTTTITVYYAHGGSSVITRTFHLERYAHFTIPTGYTQLGLAPDGLSPVIYWTIQVEHPGESLTPLSEVFTYVADTRYFRDSRYFIYQNAFGCTDTLRTVGVNRFAVKRKTETASRATTSATDMNRGSIEMVYNELSQEWTMRTGWLLNKEEKDFLLDFITSRYVAEVVMPMPLPVVVVDPLEEDPTYTLFYRQRYRSVIVQQDTIDMWEENDGTYGLEWKMKYAHDDVKHTNIPLSNSLYYDDFVEFTITVTNLTDSTPTIEITQLADYGRLLINGAPSSFGVNGVGLGVYFVRVESYKLLNLTIDLDDCRADIKITKIDSRWLKRLDVLGYDSIGGDYLTKRLRNWWQLEQLTLTTRAGSGIAINDMLAALAQLHREHPGNLTDINFINDTPSTTGDSIADYLSGEGISVVTG